MRRCLGIAGMCVVAAIGAFIVKCKLRLYTVFSCDRENAISGGVILYVHSSLHPILLQADTITDVDSVFVVNK